MLAKVVKFKNKVEKFVKVLIISDLHCGALWGICHPAWWCVKPNEPTTSTVMTRLYETQSSFWNWFEEMIKFYGPFDYIICNGDLIHGQNVKAYGRGVNQSISEQQKMAVEVIKTCGSPSKVGGVIITYGSGYHVGDNQDNEESIVNLLRTEGYNVIVGRSVTGEEDSVEVLFNLCGYEFLVSHFIGKSQGLNKPAMSNKLQNAINRWWNKQLKKIPNVIISSHVHEYTEYRKKNGIVVTSPALCLPADPARKKWGGLVDTGFLVMRLPEKKGDLWERPAITEVTVPDNLMMPTRHILKLGK